MSNWGGLGTVQRRWILERDGSRCQHFSFFGRWVQCSATKDLHCHHILPQRHMTTHMPHVDPHRPENLIMLCGSHHHNGANGVHPDMNKALQGYRKGNKRAFEEAFTARNVQVSGGDIYWDPKNDWQYSRRAKKNTRKFSRGNPYPGKRRKKGWRRPK